jgi:hypothetical protein
MPNKLTKAEFIVKAVAVHGVGRYDYSQMVYIGAEAKIQIGCPFHGFFEQRAGNHINAASGCPACKSERIGQLRRHTTTQFIEKAQAKHGTVAYDYSLVSYTKDTNTVKIICPTHGVFEQLANSHLAGHGCQECGKYRTAKSHLHSQEEFIRNAKNKHGEAYDYSLTEYRHGREAVTIICPIHDAFKQTPHEHLSGNGCRQCGYASLRKSWVERAGGRPGTLYFIKLFNEQESFYKVGVTYGSASSRYAQSKMLGGYSYEILAQHTSPDAARIFDWEQSILETFAHLKYNPKQRFGGETECFSSADEILAIFPL